jgi:ribosome-binding protein aMBF1 (putative translation factor)
MRRQAICGQPMRRYETPERGGIPDWLTCGRRPGHPGRHESTLSLAARKLSQDPTGSPVLAAALRRARGRAGLSQRALAAAVGVSRPAIQQYERAARTPSAEVWVQLELTLGPLGIVRDLGPEAAEVAEDAA